MTQRPIPFLFMRGGTSRGPYFNKDNLPQDRESLADVLCAVIGAGHYQNIDGIGGGTPVTTKVAMLSRNQDGTADIDYFFGQVQVDAHLVDFSPTCGNILSGVGPAAIEMGLFPASDGETRLRIRAVNTGALVDAVVQTPNGKVTYSGDIRIDGVPGTAAPITLQFREIVGSVTGKLLPTGNVRDVVNGIEVTCLDVAMPLVIARAEAFGLRGDESAAELDANEEFSARREEIRVLAGRLMGMGDVRGKVVPKFGLLAPSRGQGTASVRYFMPLTCHPTMAVTGAQCLATCLLLPGGVGEGLHDVTPEGPIEIVLEHASGQIRVIVDYSLGTNAADEPICVRSVGVVRTARLLAQGEVLVPNVVWPELVQH